MKRLFSLFAIFALGCGGAAETVAATSPPEDASMTDPLDGFVTIPIIPGPPVFPPPLVDASDDDTSVSEASDVDDAISTSNDASDAGDASLHTDADATTVADSSVDSGSGCHHHFFF